MTLALVHEWQDGKGTAYDDAASVVAHELGHNVKVRTHYTDIKWFPGTKLDAVTPWDIMGKSPSLNHFLGWAKADCKWIPATSVETVGPPSGADIDSTVTLKPQEVATGGVQVSRFLSPRAVLSTAMSWKTGGRSTATETFRTRAS